MAAASRDAMILKAKKAGLATTTKPAKNTTAVRKRMRFRTALPSSRSALKFGEPYCFSTVPLPFTTLVTFALSPI